MKRYIFPVLLAAALTLSACSSAEAPPTEKTVPEATSVEETPEVLPDPVEPEPTGPMTLTSTSFEHEGQIPTVYALPPFTKFNFRCDGAEADKENRSPALNWENVPPDTESLALIMADKLSYAIDNAPKTSLFTHWIVYNLPPTTTGLPEALPDELILPEGAMHGQNNFPEPYKTGYGGPCPPFGGGEHLYIFTLYALDTTLDLPNNLMAEGLQKVMKGHIIAEAELRGYFTNQ